MRLAAGHRLGPYEIVAPLGAGGMGEVYRARDTRLRRDVALKLILPQPGATAGTVDRFRREAIAASALNHPNIITIYDIGEAPEGRFIAMELVDGHTLRPLMTTLSFDAVPRVGVQIARALDVAHEAGIVHRDIKPENIMLRGDGYVKVLDFGLARFSEGRVFVTDETTAQTDERTLLGTVRYMSPEQARGEAVDRAADVFALGIVLYELCTAQHPFEAGTPLGVLHAIASHTPVAPARITPGVPDRLNDLILRMLAHDERRRPSAKEVATELADLERAVPSQLVSSASSALRRTVVGRTRERAALQSALESVTAGRGLLVTISGEAGIGKTTLVEDFLSELPAGDGRYRIARGRCSERLAGTEAYLPVLEALGDLVSRGPADSLIRLVKTLAPTWYDQLKPVTAGGTSDSRVLPIVKAASPERFKLELTTLLQEVSRRDTMILFFDDLHWADVSTVDLLSYLATRFDSMRLLIVATYRPTEVVSLHPFASLRLELQGRSLCREISLPFLERQDVDAYLTREFPRHHFPLELGALVHRRTEGSPLFMVDLIRELRERGVLAEADGHWTATQSMASIEQEMPGSIRSLIQRTIDRLDDSDRQLLTAASVQGYDFDAAAIARAIGRDPVDVEDRFDAIERGHGLLCCTGEKELPDRTLTLGYRFVHVLYQNALYASLRPARRASLSGAVASALLQFHGAKSSGIAAELAMLFEAAREPSPAADYLLMATQNAVQVFAGEEAIALARRGLRVLEMLPASMDRARRELRFQILLGAALAARKGYSDPEVEVAHVRTRALCLEVGDVPETFSALYGVYTFFQVRADFRAGLEILDQLLRLAVTERDPTRLLIAHAGYAAPLLHTGDFKGTLSRLEESLGAYDPAAYGSYPHLEVYGADPRTTVSIWLALGLWFAGRPDQSFERAQESLGLARTTGQPLTLTYVFTLLAWLHFYRREPEAVERWAGEAIALCRQHGFNQWLAFATMYWGWARAARGQPEEALPAMQYALTAYRAAGGLFNVPTFLAMMAEARMGTDPVAAIQLVSDALDIGRSTGERCWEADLHRLHGELLSGQPGREIEGEQSLLRALDVARDLGARVLELRAATSLAGLYRRQGRGEAGREVLAAACNWFTEGLETPDLREARQLLDGD